MTDTSTECLFCKIAANEIPAQIITSNERLIAFRDISPQAPTHVLVVPREHYTNVAMLAAADPMLLAELVSEGTQIAENEAGGDYRLVFNTGRRAGQTVFHVHGHILGGRDLTWPPG